MALLAPLDPLLSTVEVTDGPVSLVGDIPSGWAASVTFGRSIGRFGVYSLKSTSSATPADLLMASMMALPVPHMDHAKDARIKQESLI